MQNELAVFLVAKEIWIGRKNRQSFCFAAAQIRKSVLVELRADARLADAMSAEGETQTPEKVVTRDLTAN